MFYQLEGNETFSCNSHIFICIPSEPQWKMKDFISFLKGRFPLKRYFYVFTRVKFTCVYKVEEMYEKAACKRKIEQGSTWTFTRDLPYIAFMLFARVKFARERT